MRQSTALLEFAVDGRLHALPLSVVEHVAWAVETTPIPDAPAAVAGAIRIAGVVVPVLSMRRLLQAPDREMEPSDRLVIVRCDGIRAALLVDDVAGVVEIPPGCLVSAGAAAGGGPVAGFVSDSGGLVLVHDPTRLLRFGHPDAWVPAEVGRAAADARGGQP